MLSDQFAEVSKNNNVIADGSQPSPLDKNYYKQTISFQTSNNMAISVSEFNICRQILVIQVSSISLIHLKMS